MGVVPCEGCGLGMMLRRGFLMDSRERCEDFLGLNASLRLSGLDILLGFWS